MVYNIGIGHRVLPRRGPQEGTVLASDLHCHTKISDGSMGIEEVLTIAKRRGLKAVAITDHDNTAGSTRAVVIGRRLGVNVIHGVEFSTYDEQRGNKAHLLCYLCDAPDRLEGLCRRICENRRTAGMEMIRKVMRYYPITPELVLSRASGSTSIYRQHIMHALIDAGYADSFYGELYEKLFGEGGSVPMNVRYPDTRDVLKAVHEAGGIAVLAHPVSYKNEALLEELVALGLDGVEAWHPTQTPEQTEQLLSFANENGLVVTGGSDFHGMYAKSVRPLGSTAMPDEYVDMLLEYKAKKARGGKEGR